MRAGVIIGSPLEIRARSRSFRASVPRYPPVPWDTVVARSTPRHHPDPDRRLPHHEQRRAAGRPHPQLRDALTALPLGIAFFLRSARGEKAAGYFVVATIFVSACVALWQTIERLIDPQPLSHLGALAAAGAVGFIGNQIAALIRLRAGKRLDSPALVADGYHARTDGLVSLGVVGSAIIVALGFELGDLLIGLAITLIILRITWQSWRTIRAHQRARTRGYLSALRPD